MIKISLFNLLKLGIMPMAICTFATSCEQKDLCFHHDNEESVRVVYDWSEAPEASPQGMVVYLYNVDSDEVQRFDLPGTEGGIINLKPGVWDVITYNNDTEAVDLLGVNDSFTHFLTTREGNPLEGALGNAAPSAKNLRDNDEPIRISPDMMWGSAISDHSVTVKRGEENIINLSPRPLVATYTYEIRNVSNLKHATQICGVITGLSGGLYPYTEILHPDPVTLPYSSSTQGQDKIIGSFFTFGNHHEYSSRHKMLLYVWMDDGQKYIIGKNDPKFDVTGQVDSAPDRLNVHIVIEGVVLPDPISNGSGFTPSTDDWIDENHDIDL